MEHKRRLRIMLPENSTWVMLFTPFIVGILATWRFAVADFALAGLLFFLGLLRTPLSLWITSGFKKLPPQAKTTLVLAAAHGLFLSLILLLKYHLSLLIPIGLLGFLFFYVESRLKRGAARDFLAIGILTLSAPAAFYASHGALTPVALVLWLLCAIYFGFTTIYTTGALRNPVKVRHSLRWLLTHAAIFTTAVTLLLSFLRV